MYENFTLKEMKKGIIQGYSWPLENPDKVVCIIHGIGEYGGRYDRMAGKFAEANIATLSMDLRGHGDSIGSKGDCAPRDLVLDDICDLILHARTKYPNTPIILYGHSMGGNILLDFRNRGAFNNIPEKYIITGPWIRLIKPIEGALAVLLKVMSKLAPSATIGSAVDEEILGNPNSVKPYKTNPMVHNRISFGCAADGKNIGEAIEKGTLEDNGNAHNIPTLIMHGTADKICDITGTEITARRMIDEGQNVRFKPWEGLFHEIHNGNLESNGDEVIQYAIDFIKEQ